MEIPEFSTLLQDIKIPISIQLPASKSLSNRYLILRHFYPEIALKNLSTADDTVLLHKALDTLNYGKHEDIPKVFVGYSGTAFRFFLALAAGTENLTVLMDGEARLGKRPIEDLLWVLKDLGAEFQQLSIDSLFPFIVKGKKWERQHISLPRTISSQFASALMLASARPETLLPFKITFNLNQTSYSYIEMTAQVLREVGCDVHMENSEFELRKKPDETLGKSIVVEADWSSATFFYSLAAAGNFSFILEGLQLKSMQGESKIAEIFSLYFSINSIQVESSVHIYPTEKSKNLQSVCLNLVDMPDAAQAIACLCAFQKREFYLTGLETLPFKETDRLKALQIELNKIGCTTDIGCDFIKSIDFSPAPEWVHFNTYEDHRMAMALSIFGTMMKISFDDGDVVSKSFPHFWEEFQKCFA